jgi:hypothetical protein
MGRPRMSQVSPRRVGAYRGVWRLHDPGRRCWSIRLWFDEDRAQRAAQRWQWGMFEAKPETILQENDNQ